MPSLLARMFNVTLIIRETNQMNNVVDYFNREFKEPVYDLLVTKVFELHGNSWELEVPYFRDYYIVGWSLLKLIAGEVIPLLEGMEMINNLLQMKVNAEVDPDDIDDEFTQSAIIELTSYVNPLKIAMAKKMRLTVMEFDKKMIEEIKKIFEVYEQYSDDEESQLEYHEENFEEDSNVIVDSSLINEDRLYESIISLFSKRNQVGEEDKYSSIIEMKYSNDDYSFLIAKNIDPSMGFIMIENNKTLHKHPIKRLKTIFDGNEDNKIIWEVLKTFKINKSQVKSVYDNGI